MTVYPTHRLVLDIPPWLQDILANLATFSHFSPQMDDSSFICEIQRLASSKPGWCTYDINPCIYQCDILKAQHKLKSVFKWKYLMHHTVHTQFSMVFSDALDIFLLNCKVFCVRSRKMSKHLRDRTGYVSSLLARRLSHVRAIQNAFEIIEGDDRCPVAQYL